jgi:hypothetical protein
MRQLHVRTINGVLPGATPFEAGRSCPSAYIRIKRIRDICPLPVDDKNEIDGEAVIVPGLTASTICYMLIGLIDAVITVIVFVVMRLIKERVLLRKCPQSLRDLKRKTFHRGHIHQSDNFRSKRWMDSVELREPFWIK